MLISKSGFGDVYRSFENDCRLRRELYLVFPGKYLGQMHLPLSNHTYRSVRESLVHIPWVKVSTILIAGAAAQCLINDAPAKSYRHLSLQNAIPVSQSTPSRPYIFTGW